MLWVFNTVLGEELLFRGYLLPRMAGSFVRADWLVNGLLFAGYRAHVVGSPPPCWFPAPWPLRPKYYRSALIGIAVHSAQVVFLCALVLPIVWRADTDPPVPPPARHLALPPSPSILTGGAS